MIRTDGSSPRPNALCTFDDNEPANNSKTASTKQVLVYALLERCMVCSICQRVCAV